MTWTLMLQTLVLTAFIAVTSSLASFIVAYKQGVKDGYLNANENLRFEFFRSWGIEFKFSL